MIDLDELERKRAAAMKAGNTSVPWVQFITAMCDNAPELIAMARRYQWLREHWARVVMTTSYAGANVPRSVEIIELGDHILGKVDPETLDAAIDAAMEQKP